MKCDTAMDTEKHGHTYLLVVVGDTDGQLRFIETP
jgi:hypothetical protein